MVSARVVIAGAGISGLASAFEIREQSAATGAAVEVVVLEKDARAGGKMFTESAEGYLCEWGPNGYLDSKVHATEFMNRVGLCDELLPANNAVNRRYLFAKGRLHILPDSPGRFLFSGLLSRRARLRVMLEPFKKPAPLELDESVSEFATRRLGREALEMLLDPFVAGVFAGNPDLLSLASCFPRIHEMEQTCGSLVKALFSLRKKRRLEKRSARKAGRTVAGATAPRGHLTSLKRGMGQLVEALEAALGSSLVRGCEVKALKKKGCAFEVLTTRGSVDADAVVLSVPAFEAAGILREVFPPAAAPLEEIEYNSLWVASLGFDEKSLARPLDGYGFLTPRSEGRRILGCLWSSSIFPARAPGGKVLLTVMVGGSRNPDLARLPAERILPLVREELADILGIASGPEFVRLRRHEKAIPQYTVGHALRLAALAEALRDEPGVFLAGNAYRGVAMADCILQARRSAGEVLTFLHSRPA